MQFNEIKDQKKINETETLKGPPIKLQVASLGLIARSRVDKTNTTFRHLHHF